MPSTQGALPEMLDKMTNPSAQDIKPLTSNQSQVDACLGCQANMILYMPYAINKIVSSKVSVINPCMGFSSKDNATKQYNTPMPASHQKRLEPLLRRACIT